MLQMESSYFYWHQKVLNSHKSKRALSVFDSYLCVATSTENPSCQPTLVWVINLFFFHLPQLLLSIFGRAEK